jgi:hypothetical protein
MSISSGPRWVRDVASSILRSDASATTVARSANTVIGRGDSVVRVSVNVYGFESEYVGGADMVTATLGGLGAELRVLKMSVSCPPAASHRISPVDTDADSGLPFAKDSVLSPRSECRGDKREFVGLWGAGRREMDIAPVEQDRLRPMAGNLYLLARFVVEALDHLVRVDGVEAFVTRRAILEERHWLLDVGVRPEEEDKAEGSTSCRL